mmetsp:Transcript_13502/g.40834  ORF Transcript_13502/g.40834 Transcript_13502/m.40834 type:complete len:160 (-) Transcript_13502:775-1254(-)
MSSGRAHSDWYPASAREGAWVQSSTLVTRWLCVFTVENPQGNLTSTASPCTAMAHSPVRFERQEGQRGPVCHLPVWPLRDVGTQQKRSQGASKKAARVTPEVDVGNSNAEDDVECEAPAQALQHPGRELAVTVAVAPQQHRQRPTQPEDCARGAHSSIG